MLGYILLIIFIIYLIYTFKPELLPNFIWKNKFVRDFNKKNKEILENFVGINISNSQLESFYKKKAQKGKVIIGLHYTDWCHFCKEMKPIWFKVKEDISEVDNSIIMFENNEEEHPTPGIDGFPTILKLKEGKLTKYQDGKNYENLKRFISDL